MFIHSEADPECWCNIIYIVIIIIIYNYHYHQHHHHCRRRRHLHQHHHRYHYGFIHQVVKTSQTVAILIFGCMALCRMQMVVKIEMVSGHTTRSLSGWWRGRLGQTTRFT